MLKQAYRHKNQQPALVPWLTPGASLIATSAFVLFVAGFIVAALMLVAVSALICIFYFASWYVFNDIVPSNRALWVRVQSLAHIAFKQLQRFTGCHRLYVFQNRDYFFTRAGSTSGFRTPRARGTRAFNSGESVRSPTVCTTVRKVILRADMNTETEWWESGVLFIQT